jgi:hypothetical protein
MVANCSIKFALEQAVESIFLAVTNVLTQSFDCRTTSPIIRNLKVLIS